ncbi:MAG: hypothetical protein ACE5F6_13335 [Anaerolineae bacterium]
MPDPTPVYLLDKNVVRKTIAGMVKVQVGRGLTQEENDALTLLQEVRKEALHLFIAPEAFNLLQRFTDQAEVGLFLELVEVMQAGRYFKRWARRLRGYGFTHEDAKVLSLGTFGTREARDILGVNAIVTLDQPFINNYQTRLDELQERLEAMTVNLSPPFCNAALPALVQLSLALALHK